MEVQKGLVAALLKRICTFVEQIRRHGKDPFAYFEWVFEKLMHHPPAEELESLLPVHWLKARAAESTPIGDQEA